MVWKCDKCGKEFEDKDKDKCEKHENKCMGDKEVKEYKRKCKECGKVWHSLVSREEKISKDLKSNTCNKQVSGCGMMGGNWTALGSATQAERNEQALQSEIDRLKKCPECGSQNYKEEIIIYEKH